MVVVLSNTDWCHFGSVDCTTPEFCIASRTEDFKHIFPILTHEEIGIRKLQKSKQVHVILLITLKSPYLCLSRKLTIFER